MNVKTRVMSARRAQRFVLQKTKTL